MNCTTTNQEIPNATRVLQLIVLDEISRSTQRFRVTNYEVCATKEQQTSIL